MQGNLTTLKLLKKKLHIRFSLVVYCFMVICDVHAQAVVTIPEATIRTGSALTTSTVGFGNSAVLSLLGINKITLATASTSSPIQPTDPATISTVPLNIIQMQVDNISGALTIVASKPLITLTTVAQDIFVPVLSLNLGSGLLTMNVFIASHPSGWVAGTYSADLIFTGMIAPLTKKFSITVPPLIEAGGILPLNTTISLSNAAAFNTDKTVVNSFNYISSLPTQLSLSSGTATFGYTKPASYSGLPNLSTLPASSLLAAKVTGATGLTGPQIQPSTTPTSLTGGSAIPVRSTNQRTIETSYTLTAVQLKANFVQAGTYTLPVKYIASRNPASYPVTYNVSPEINSNIIIEVSPFQDITAQTTAVTLNMNTAASYKNGTTTTVNSQLMANSTVPYSVTVRATTSSFSNSGGTSTIDLDVLSIKETGAANSVTLSTVATPLFTNAAPQLGRNISIDYTIPATKTGKLLNKTGSHSATIVYSITGL
ncbi:hypothetical protein ACSBL2_24265 [Pedobacter sp. AW31-3R]|uniref:hypothetical protein n=1 Tax=Pedobacter sp. AW31-3R TaxID=3445781 RepID=UPI003FA09C27